MESQSSDLLLRIAAGEVKKNLNMSALIHQSQRLQFCKRNIILASVTYWEGVHAEIVCLLTKEIKEPKRKLNPLPAIKDYLRKHNLCHPVFMEFFFDLYGVLVEAFLTKMMAELNNGMPLEKKFCYLAEELTELINIAKLELGGMEFSCASFGGEPICPNYQLCGHSDCGETPGIFHFYMTPEFSINPNIYHDILGHSIQYVRQAKSPMIMICDYRNMPIESCRFNKDSLKRFNILKDLLAGVYICRLPESAVDADILPEVAEWMIPDKAAYKKVVNTWQTRKELVRFA